MQQPKTKRDRSAYEQSVDRLAGAMHEMFGMEAAQDGNVGTNKSDQPEANREHAGRASEYQSRPAVIREDVPSGIGRQPKAVSRIRFLWPTRTLSLCAY